MALVGSPLVTGEGGTTTDPPVAPAGRQSSRCQGRARSQAGWWAAAITVILVSAGLAPPAAAASGQFPTFTGTEFKNFYYASLPLPGTQRITARPAIYGSSAADLHIQQLAERRGYRLQVTPTVPLGRYGGVTLAADAGQAWQRLLDASRRNGTPLQGNSGYRSVDTQREIFTRRLAEAGIARRGRAYSTGEIASGAADGAIESVLSFHSIPGYSRHHTGKTLDLSHAGGTNGSFASSAAYRWLSGGNYQVAKSYGFIPNYPPNAGAQGPNPEPWEFVYVGVDKIRCAIKVVPLADPNAALICGLPAIPIVGELTGDGIDDVFIYRAGPDPEGLFPGTASRQQTTRPASRVNGIYTPVAGDFNGDGIDDILWYAPGGAQDYRWTYRPDGTYSSRATTINGLYAPVAGDFNGDGIDDILWYAPGGAQDYRWTYRPDGTYSSRATTINGLYAPVAGDFNGDGIDDILWYAPGGAQDFRWTYRPDGTYSSRATTINGLYAPVAGDFNGDGIEDILWYAPGAGDDYVWYQRADGAHTSRPTWIYGSYRVAAGDHDGDGREDVVFLAPEGGSDAVWFGVAPYGFARATRSY